MRYSLTILLCVATMFAQTLMIHKQSKLIIKLAAEVRDRGNALVTCDNAVQRSMNEMTLDQEIFKVCKCKQ